MVFSRVHGFALLCISAVVRRDVTTVGRLSDAAIDISTEFDIPYWRAWARVVRGWARSVPRDPLPGLDELRDACDAYAGFGSTFCVSFFSTLLAERLAEAGDWKRGAAAAGQALEVATRTGEHWWLAESHRMRGRMLAAKGETEEAAQCYDKGLALARRQGSHALALRSAVELCRLRMSPQRTSDARELLAGVLEPFARVRAFPELDDARRLLEAIT